MTLTLTMTMTRVKDFTTFCASSRNRCRAVQPVPSAVPQCAAGCPSSVPAVACRWPWPAVRRGIRRSGAKVRPVPTPPAGSVCAARNGKELLQKLAAIRKSDLFFASKPEAYQWVYAAPVMEDGVCTAALGISIPEREYSAAYHRRICGILRKAAREIGVAVSRVSAVG